MRALIATTLALVFMAGPANGQETIDASSVSGANLTVSGIVTANTLKAVNGGMSSYWTQQSDGNFCLYASTGITAVMCYKSDNSIPLTLFRPLVGTTGSFSGPIYLLTSQTPASASDTCKTGQAAWDANYEYRCVATNTWKRTPLSSW